METEKLYYADPFLTDFTATVLDCQAGKNGYLVTLDRTAFYPEGGGQPADHGVLDGAVVTDVHEKTKRDFPQCGQSRGNQENCLRLHRLGTAVLTICGGTPASISVPGLICEPVENCDNVGISHGRGHRDHRLQHRHFLGGLLEIEAKANPVSSGKSPHRHSVPPGRRSWTLSTTSKSRWRGCADRVPSPARTAAPALPAPMCCRSGQVGLMKFLSSVQKFREGVRIELLCAGKRALEYLSRTWEQAKAIGQRLSVKPVDAAAAVGGWRRVGQPQAQRAPVEESVFESMARQAGKGQCLCCSSLPCGFRRRPAADGCRVQTCVGCGGSFRRRGGPLHAYALGRADPDRTSTLWSRP